MNKNKSSFHMGDEINGYSQQVYWIAEEIDLPNLSQENVRLRLNFNKFLQKLIYSTPAINDPNNMNPTMLKLLGAQTGVRQVIFSENNNTAKNTSGDTIIYIAGEGTTKTASLSVQTASSTPTDQSFLKRTSGNDNRKQNNKNKSGWYPDGHGCWQFFRNNVPVCGEWIKDEGKWYYTSQEGYMITGLVTINDHQYFFRSNGEMAYRWRKISDYWFYFHKTEGYMRTNRWIDDPNEWYYVDDVGHMVTGWKKIEDKWYYFDEKGKMVTGKKEIMGRNYSFNEDGSKSGNLPPLYKLDDFYFPIPEESSGYWEDQNYAANLMYLHQQYHGLITEKQKEYVSKKAILGCTKGTKLTRLDSTKAVNVSYLTDGSPVLGCTDCKVGENIHSFESCRATLDDCIGLPLTEKMSDGFQKCIPLVEESWKQDNANTPRICHDNTYTYKYALKKDAILICKYKGIIGILEVPEDEIEGSNEMVFKAQGWLELAEGNYPYIYSTKDPSYSQWTGGFNATADLTFGIGHSIQTAAEFTTISNFIANNTASDIAAEVQRYLKDDLADAVEEVNDFMSNNNVTLKQNQFDATVSLVFNCPNALSSSSDLGRELIKNSSSGNFNQQNIIVGFTYTIFQGSRIDGLVTRRNNELNLFFNADYNNYYDSKINVINAGIEYIKY